MSGPVTIQLGDITFGNNTPDSDGVTWSLSKLDGWDSPELRQQVGEVLDHGASMGVTKYAQRTISMHGIAACSTNAKGWLAWNHLATNCNLITTLPRIFDTPTSYLRVNETVPKLLYVRKGGRLQMAFIGGTNIEFDISLVATDPRKYSVTLNESIQTGTSVTLANAGDFPTKILAIQNSGRNNAFIQNATDGNRRVEIAGNTGNLTEFDFYARTITSVGINVYNNINVATSQWWDLLPGNNAVSFDDDFTFRWRDAWI